MIKPTHAVLLVEDHALLRAGLKSLIDSEPGMQVCGEAVDGLEVVRACARLRPNLVLMDLSMPGRNGVPAIRDIRRRWPHIRILVLSAHREPGVVRDALLAGANGYVVKDATAGELVMGMRRVLAGERYISTDVVGAMIDGFLQRRPIAALPAAGSHLTSREIEVLRLVADGLTSRQIAARLDVSIKTVETHRMNLMRKLDLHRASEVTAYAIAHGLMQPPHFLADRAAGGCAALENHVGS